MVHLSERDGFSEWAHWRLPRHRKPCDKSNILTPNEANTVYYREDTLTRRWIKLMSCGWLCVAWMAARSLAMCGCHAHDRICLNENLVLLDSCNVRDHYTTLKQNLSGDGQLSQKYFNVTFASNFTCFECGNFDSRCMIQLPKLTLIKLT